MLISQQMLLCKTNNWIIVALIQFMQNHTKIVQHNILCVVYLAGFEFGGCIRIYLLGRV
jgi:hypothetical protein